MKKFQSLGIVIQSLAQIAAREPLACLWSRPAYLIYRDREDKFELGAFGGYIKDCPRSNYEQNARRKSSLIGGGLVGGRILQFAYERRLRIWFAFHLVAPQGKFLEHPRGAKMSCLAGCKSRSSKPGNV